MIDNQKILKDLNENTARVEKAFQEFPNEQFHENPSAEGWSAANIGEHLASSEKVINRLVIDGPTIPTDRDPMEKVPKIYHDFLQFDRQFPSPSFLMPKNPTMSRQQIIDDFGRYRKEIALFIEKEDLSLVCKGGKHPHFGTLTRVGWIYFNIVHADRHLHQMNQLIDG